jgi:GTPase SAR1 family protein
MKEVIHSFADFCVDWISEIKRMTPENTPLVLVGNKSDMTSKRIVEATEAMAFAEKSGIKYFETSAKTGQNIDPAFMALGELCVEHALEFNYLEFFIEISVCSLSNRCLGFEKE